MVAKYSGLTVVQSHFKRAHVYPTMFVIGVLTCYLTIIIPRVRMGSESIAHEAEGRMGY